MLQPFQQLGQWDEAADLVRKYDKARMEKLGEGCYGRGEGRRVRGKLIGGRVKARKGSGCEGMEWEGMDTGEVDRRGEGRKLQRAGYTGYISPS
jgi:hypothetical protein